ncbi:MAG: DMT family transporter [Bacillota bacterium]
MNKKAYLSIILGASFWGLISIFVQKLYSFGFNSLEIVTLRVSTAAVLMIVYIIFSDKSVFKIKFKDFPFFIGTGVFSIVFFSWCYFSAIKIIPVSIAVVLLYTAPAFVAVLSRIIFKELLTKRKIIALVLTFMGIILIVGWPQADGRVSFLGLLLGLGSGFGYSLYSIFGKAALNNYSSKTITTYSFIFASVFMIPLSKLWTKSHLFNDEIVWLYIIGLGLIPTVLAYILYTIGLSKIESSKASITATVEPLVATGVGVIIYNEVLTLRHLGGMVLVILAIILINKKEGLY